MHMGVVTSLLYPAPQRANLQKNGCNFLIKPDASGSGLVVGIKSLIPNHQIKWRRERGCGLKRKKEQGEEGRRGGDSLSLSMNIKLNLWCNFMNTT